MENIINSIRSLFGTYGFRAAATVLAVVAIVNLIKKPIVKRAEKLTELCGLDKSVVTKNVTFLPVAVAFIIDFFAELMMSGFKFVALDFGKIVSDAVMYGALAVATYESVKKQLEAYAAKKNGPTVCKPEEQNASDKTVDRNASDKTIDIQE